MFKKLVFKYKNIQFSYCAFKKLNIKQIYRWKHSCIHILVYLKDRYFKLQPCSDWLKSSGTLKQHTEWVRSRSHVHIPVRGGGPAAPHAEHSWFHAPAPPFLIFTFHHLTGCGIVELVPQSMYSKVSRDTCSVCDRYEMFIVICSSTKSVWILIELDLQ